MELSDRPVSPVSVRRSEESDYEKVAALLRKDRLPLDGLRESLDHGLVALAGGEIVGCVTLELYGEHALLRSLAVSSGWRGQGLGLDLTARVLSLAGSLGARDVYLLTETAGGFFPRFGFSAEDRSAAPDALRDSVEFRTACPESALLMHARLAS